MITNTRYVQRSVFTKGRTRSIDTIVLHQYNTPEAAGTYRNTINWLFNSAPVSIHYVVSGRSATRMVRESDTAWHAMEANSRSIGVEFDPNNMDYQFAAEFVAWIAKRHNIDRILSHNQAMRAATACPATINWQRIRDNALKGGNVKVTRENAIRLLRVLKYVGTPSEKDIQSWTGRDLNDLLRNVRNASWHKKNHEAVKNYDPNRIKELRGAWKTEEKKRQELEKELDKVIDLDNETIGNLESSLKDTTSDYEDAVKRISGLEDRIEELSKQTKPVEELKASDHLRALINKALNWVNKGRKS